MFERLFFTTTYTDEISINDKIKDICLDIATNVNSTYAAEFTVTCQNQYYASSFVLYDFLSYYSQCGGGYYCPLYGSVGQGTSSNREDLIVAAGTHVIRPTATYQCGPGFYCPQDVNSDRVSCPVGFKCPSSSMINPIPCKTGLFFENSCLNLRQTVETYCPNGFLCRSPAKSTPIPPSYFSTIKDRKNLILCKNGQYCPLGTTLNTDIPYSTLCPGGYYCPAVTNLYPLPCTKRFDTLGRQINSQVNFTEFCPPGTIGAYPHKCPQFFRCPDTQTQIICEDGLYCPVGTQYGVDCPAGTYCPQQDAFLLCPVGFYCREGTSNPTRCQFLIYCPEGSFKEQTPLAWLLFSLVILIIGFIMFQCIQLCVRQARKKRKKSKLTRNEKGGQGSITEEDFEEGEFEEGKEQLHYTGDDQEILPTKTFTVDIEMNNLTVKRLKNNKTELKGLTGKIYHGKTTCILSEKHERANIFIHLLAGESYKYDIDDGVLFVNGIEENNLQTYHNLIGLVTNDDVLFEKFKVHENIRFTAHRRLPRNFTYSEISYRMDVVMSVLGIDWIGNKHVGKKGENLNLTNYQRRMINLATELIPEPSLLFLEDPIKDLSFSEQFTLARKLKIVARSGVATVASLHRPRFEVYSQFDDVLLLGKDGAVVYNGPTRFCPDYFLELGFKCPDYQNPVDFILDIVEGSILRPGDKSFTPDNLVKLWKMKQNDKNKPWSKSFEGIIEKPTILSSLEEDKRVVSAQTANEKKKKQIRNGGTIFFIHNKIIIRKYSSYKRSNF